MAESSPPEPLVPTDGRLPTIYFQAVVRKLVLAQIYVNDLPVFKEAVLGPDSFGGPFNYLLVSGANRVAFEVHTAPPLGDVDAPEPPPGPPAGVTSTWDEHPLSLDPTQSIGLTLFTVADVNAEPIVPDLRARVSFPRCCRALPIERRRLPCYVEASVFIDAPIPPRAWRSAPFAQFGCGGTPELHRAVLDAHEALATRDLDRWLGLIELETTELAASVGAGSTDALASRRELYEELFRFPIALAAHEPGMLHFTPRCGGRVAHVTRHDGRPVLDGTFADPDAQRVRSNLLLTQHEGQWRIM
jgi:hypothetical protein